MTLSEILLVVVVIVIEAHMKYTVTYKKTKSTSGGVCGGLLCKINGFNILNINHLVLRNLSDTDLT